MLDMLAAPGGRGTGCETDPRGPAEDTECAPAVDMSELLSGWMMACGEETSRLGYEGNMEISERGEEG